MVRGASYGSGGAHKAWTAAPHKVMDTWVRVEATTGLLGRRLPHLKDAYVRKAKSSSTKREWLWVVFAEMNLYCMYNIAAIQ